MSSFKTVLSLCALIHTISSCSNGANPRPILPRQFGGRGYAAGRGHMRNTHDNVFAGPRNAAADSLEDQQVAQLHRDRVQQFNIAAGHAYADVFADPQRPTDSPKR